MVTPEKVKSVTMSKVRLLAGCSGLMVDIFTQRAQRSPRKDHRVAPDETEKRNNTFFMQALEKRFLKSSASSKSSLRSLRPWREIDGTLLPEAVPPFGSRMRGIYRARSHGLGSAFRLSPFAFSLQPSAFSLQPFAFRL